jgi:drug/metabolite transporter (DMT)-like permease
MIILFLVYALFASTFTIGQAALKYTQPVFLIAFRMGFAGVLILSYLALFKKKLLKFDAFNFILLTQISIFHIFIPYVTEFWGLQYVGSAKAAILYGITPFVTAIFEKFMFKVPVTRNKLIGLTIGFLGFIPILYTATPKEQLLNAFFRISLPELAILISAISSCYGWILIKKSIVYEKYSPLFANGIGMLGGGFLSILTSFFIEKWNPIPTTNFGMMFFYIVLMIIIGNVIFYNSYGWLLHKYSATFLSFFGFSIPLFAAFYQWLFFGELVTWQFFLTSAMIAVGLYIFYKDELSTSQLS